MVTDASPKENVCSFSYFYFPLVLKRYVGGLDEEPQTRPKMKCCGLWISQDLRNALHICAPFLWPKKLRCGLSLTDVLLGCRCSMMWRNNQLEVQNNQTSPNWSPPKRRRWCGRVCLYYRWKLYAEIMYYIVFPVQLYFVLFNQRRPVVNGRPCLNQSNTISLTFHF